MGFPKKSCFFEIAKAGTFLVECISNHTSTEKCLNYFIFEIFCNKSDSFEVGKMEKMTNTEDKLMKKALNFSVGIFIKIERRKI